MPTLSDSGATRSARFAAALLAAALLPLAGCGQPQVASDHRELVQKLATGASTQDRGIIDRAASEIDQLDAAGKLIDDEEAAFRAIIDSARSGDWERAQSRAYALRDGQEPTEADKQRVAARTLPGIKKPGDSRRGSTAP